MILANPICNSCVGVECHKQNRRPMQAVKTTTHRRWHVFVTTVVSVERHEQKLGQKLGPMQAVETITHGRWHVFVTTVVRVERHEQKLRLMQAVETITHMCNMKIRKESRRYR